jgi:excisionase family DNA binding protein
MISENMVKEFIGIDELSQYLGIKKSSLYSMVEKKEIPHYKIGRLVRFRKADIDAWVGRLRVEVVNTQIEANRIINCGQSAQPHIIKSVSRKTVARPKAINYTSHNGRPDEIKDLGKEVSNV